MRIEIPYEPVTASRPQVWHNRAQYRKKYLEFREEVGDWVAFWLRKTDNLLVKELVGGQDLEIDGKHVYNTPFRYQDKGDGKTPKLRNDFYGFYVYMELVCKPVKPGTRKLFPMGQRSGDLDNYYKAVTDLFFQQQVFKDKHIDDSMIVQSNIVKRYPYSADEKPHIIFEIRRWTLNA